MSAINCCGDEIVYGNPFPGWYLFQLVNVVVPYQEGTVIMNEGDWGLTRGNDPDFSFSVSPVKELEEDELENWEQRHTAYIKVLDHYQERLIGPIEAGYELVQACIQAGWDMQEGGLPSFVMDRMARQIEQGVQKVYKRI